MFNLSAESFPDDQVVSNLSNNSSNSTNRQAISHPLETLELVQLSPDADETTTKHADDIPSEKLDSGAEALKLYTKSLTNGSRRIGGAFKRPALSKKSASVDSLHNGSRNDQTSSNNKQHGGSNNSLGAISKRATYKHVQSKVKVDIDNARQQENKRRSKFQRHQSMPETVCPDPNSLADIPDGQTISNDELVRALREQVVAKDLLISQKNLLLSQMHFLSESVEQESHDKLKLQRKIEAMRMEIMKVNAQNLQYQEELRVLTLKVTSNSGSASAVSSSGSFPISGVHTDSSAGSSCRQQISYSSSSGVSSVSPAFPSDDRFLVQRKPIKRTDSGCVLMDRSIDNHQYRQMDHSPSGDIVLFDKSHIDDCQIISSSSTSNELFDGFHQESAPKKAAALSGSRKRRRKNFAALRKRLRQMAKYCAPCLKHNNKGESDDGLEIDTSLLYTELDGEFASNSRYNSFN